MLILKIAQLDITFDQFFYLYFYSIYTSACNLVSAVFVCGCSKG